VMSAARSAERSVNSSAIRYTTAARSATERVRHAANASVAAASASVTSASVANGNVSVTSPVAGSVT
jgi:multidrug efflux pump subunit AcrA (membrane-fusion protein)